MKFSADGTLTRNPLVERVAKALYEGRNTRPPWSAIADHRREGYRETAREVLLAAMNAGLIISEHATASAKIEAKAALAEDPTRED